MSDRLIELRAERADLASEAEDYTNIVADEAREALAAWDAAHADELAKLERAHKAGSWYTTSKPDAAQGLICDEITGKNVAVSYDVKDAPLIAAAPRLLAALKDAREALRNAIHTQKSSPAAAIAWRFAEDQARAAISDAESPL